MQPFVNSDPVDQLLSLGDPGQEGNWLNYLELGLRAEHIPALIAMATDIELSELECNDPAVWASLHAWRAIGQLQADAAIVPLLNLPAELPEDDYVGAEIPIVLSMIGPRALRPAADFLADESNDLRSRWVAADALAEIAKRHPECRDECIAAIAGQLQQFARNDRNLNGFLVSYLLDFNSTEQLPVIRAAFAADAVEPMLVRWRHVQEAFGIDESLPAPPVAPGSNPLREQRRRRKAQQRAARKSAQRRR